MPANISRWGVAIAFEHSKIWWLRMPLRRLYSVVHVDALKNLAIIQTTAVVVTTCTCCFSHVTLNLELLVSVRLRRCELVTSESILALLGHYAASYGLSCWTLALQFLRPKYFQLLLLQLEHFFKTTSRAHVLTLGRESVNLLTQLLSFFS